MIIIPGYNKIQVDDDITMINAKLNGIGILVKNVSVEDYKSLIEDLLKVIPKKLILEQRIVAQSFRNIISVYDSIDDLLADRCILVIKTSLKVFRQFP